MSSSSNKRKHAACDNPEEAEQADSQGSFPTLSSAISSSSINPSELAQARNLVAQLLAEKQSWQTQLKAKDDEIASLKAALRRKNNQDEAEAVNITTRGREQSPASAADIQKFLNEADIWVDILSFVGPGQNIFVGFVCRILRKHNKRYFATIPNPPMVLSPTREDLSSKRQATDTDTFFSEVFSTVPRAKFFDTITSSKDAAICAKAARYGKLPALQFFRKKNYPWDVNTCMEAAGNGHLEVLKWAHNNGCPWDAGTCEAARENNHPEVLKWARRNGCPCDLATGFYAAELMLNEHLADIEQFDYEAFLGEQAAEAALAAALAAEEEALASDDASE